MGIIALRNKISQLRQEYWSGNCSTPDSEYDALIEQLRKLSPLDPLLTTPEHGSLGGKQVVHKTPMLSLQKVYSEKDLFDWVQKISRSEDEVFLVQPKYDGVSCHYDQGVFSTRGDGEVGEDVTAVCKALCQVEKVGDDKSYYGELVIKDSDFNGVYKSIKTAAGTGFKNSRNAIAGILGTDDFSFYEKQGAVITLIDYRRYSFSSSCKDFQKKWYLIRSVIYGLDYPMDGIVVKLADEKYAQSLGCTSHHPRGAMAFKFANESAHTTLKDIEFGMGKNSITATAVFEPITISGTTITRAVVPMVSKTLPCVSNGDFKQGSKLVVERAGDVIPHIVSVDNNGINNDPFGLTVCPYCGATLIFEESAARCPNDDCPEKKIQRLYCSLVTLGAENIGLATVRSVSAFIKNYYGGGIGLLNWMMYVPTADFASRFSLESGFGNSSANSIVGETIKIAKTTMAKFLAALNIPGIGIKVGTLLMERYNISELLTCGEAHLVQIPGIGPVIAKRFVEYVSCHRGYIQVLASKFTMEVPAAQTSTVNTPSVCFTGAMKLPRSQMMDMAKKAGMQPTNVLTKSVNLLVLADQAAGNSSKCAKAAQYGIKIVKESEFVAECQKKLGN